MPSHQRSHELRSETKAGRSRPTVRAAQKCCDKTVFSRVGEFEEPQTRLEGTPSTR